MDFYENFVLHGGPLDGQSARIRQGTVAVQVDADRAGRYVRVGIAEAGLFVRNEYHWAAGVAA